MDLFNDLKTSKDNQRQTGVCLLPLKIISAILTVKPVFWSSGHPRWCPLITERLNTGSFYSKYLYYMAGSASGQAELNSVF